MVELKIRMRRVDPNAIPRRFPREDWQARCAATLLAFAISGCDFLPLLSPCGDPLVPLASVNPRIRQEIRYATANNFTGRVLYDTAGCYLRLSVARALSRVQEDLEPLGLGLKIFDAYRPLSVQWELWAIVPDERYVANPAKGSRHNRGAAVDLTLVDSKGRELPMPTGYDDFSERAHRDYSNLPAEAVANRALLERAMIRRGFVPLPTEWWHFDAAGWERLPLLDLSFREIETGRRTALGCFRRWE